MTSRPRHPKTRVLVPIKPEQFQEAVSSRIPEKLEPLPQKAAKGLSEFDKANLIRVNNSDGQLAMTSRYSIVKVHAAVKQETMSNYAPKTTRIKREKDNSYNNESNFVNLTNTQAFTAQSAVPTKKCKIDPENIKTIYRCSCKQIFNDKFQHFHHMLDHMAEKIMRVKCKYCDRHFKSVGSMRTHLKCKHTGFKCNYCTEVFPAHPMWLQHMVLYHNYVTKKQQLKYQKHFQKQQQVYYRELINRQRQMWEDVYRQEGGKSKYKINRKKAAPSSSKVKIEPTSKVKIEPTYSNVKVEPSYANVKIEPTFSNIKIEPICSNIKVEPT